MLASRLIPLYIHVPFRPFHPPLPQFLKLMLTLRPQPPPTRFPNGKMYQRRGRSRQVSHAALARQASEERRTRRATTPLPVQRSQEKEGPSHEDVHLTQVNVQARGATTGKVQTISDAESGPVKETLALIKALPLAAIPPIPTPSPPSSASMSPDYYDSPPTPLARSLEDQVHIAYALDDIHLAKVLLLKLKGIEVTSDEDPRIAAVQDEDFDMCFFPHGKLMDEADEKALFEQQRKESEKLAEKRRQDRLRACERIWEQEKKRLREARALALRKKEGERKRAEEEKRIKAAKEKEAAERRARANRTRSGQSLGSRSVVSYEILGRLREGSSHAQSSRVHLYPFMTPTTRTVKSSQTPSQPQSQSFKPFTRPTYDESRSVPFRDVLASMQGPLFPVERRAASPNYSSSQDRRKHRENELLDSLLKVVEWELDERRKLKGKWTERPTPQRTSVSSCIACSVSSPSPSSSLESSSRRSWLSFSSVSSSSAPTTVTTPSTSPPRSWFSKAVTPPSPVLVSRNQLTSLIVSRLPLPPHSCQSPPCFTPVPLAESPLPMSTLHEPSPNPAAMSSEPDSRTEHTVTPSSGRVARRVSLFVGLAKELQNAYMNATFFAVTVSSDVVEHRTVSAASVPRPTQPSCCRAKRAGYRALAADVAVFLGDSNPQDWTPPVTSIPLRLWGPSTNTPRSTLPDPLPYPIRFKPLPKPCRSPFRLNAHLVLVQRRPNPAPAPWAPHISNGADAGVGTGASETVTWRMRTVENPAYLRLKALQNVLWDEGVKWQGQAREGSLGAGRERMLKVTFEGIGRSWLGGGADVGFW